MAVGLVELNYGKIVLPVLNTFLKFYLRNSKHIFSGNDYKSNSVKGIQKILLSLLGGTLT